jgi:hypothetical protein
MTAIVKLLPPSALKDFLLAVKAMPDARPVVKELRRLMSEHPYGSGERKALRELVGFVECFGLQRTGT